MSFEKAFDGLAFMNLGIVENHHQQGIGKTLMELMEKVNEHLRRPTLGPFPIEPLGVWMQRPKHTRRLTLCRLRRLGLFAFSEPAPSDIGLIGKVGFIDKENLDATAQLTLGNGIDDLCHPVFFHPQSVRL